MKSSLLTYYILGLVFIFIAIYIFSSVDAQVYHLPKEPDIKNAHIETEIEKDDIELNLDEVSVEVNNEKPTEVKEQYISLGEFKLTAYCPCSKCCGQWANNRPNGIVYGATGEELKEEYSIAVDPNVIPYGTEVVINGNTYKAQDCGGAIKGNRIDVYFNNHQDALDFGVQYAQVYINSENSYWQIM